MMHTRLNRTEREVIKAFASNDMNLSKAAKEIYLSRGGAFYRLNLIRKKTGLNPFRFYELIELLKEANGE